MSYAFENIYSCIHKQSLMSSQPDFFTKSLSYMCSPKSRLRNGLSYAECLLASALGGNFCGMEGRSASEQREKSGCLHSRGQRHQNSSSMDPPNCPAPYWSQRHPHCSKRPAGEGHAPGWGSCLLPRPSLKEVTAEDGLHSQTPLPTAEHTGVHLNNMGMTARQSLELPTDTTWELWWNNGIQLPSPACLIEGRPESFSLSESGRVGLC